jgi:hypothetical protein
MARNTKPKQPDTGDNPFKDYGFINFSLTRQQKDECDAWAETTDSDTILSYIDDMVQSGLKLSSSWGSNGVAFATLTDKDYSRAYNKRILSVRARNPIKAIKRLVWLHYIHASSNWENLEDQTDEVW